MPQHTSCRPAITGFGLMALVGFYAALMPSILSHDLHIDSHAAAGALFFELAAVVAVSAGLGYRGSLQVVNQIAPAEQRAAVVSTYFFVCCFTGNALPVIGVGVLSTIVDRTLADVAFAGTITAFAVVALVLGRFHRR